jgi:polysaccharide export outer membrane protein
MKHCSFWLLLAMSLWLVGCSAYKDVPYFQNAEDIRGMTLQPQQFIQLQPGDKINIFVTSSDPLLMQQFNLMMHFSGVVPMGSSGAKTTAYNSGSNMAAYTIDDQGDIFFPVLGKVSVKGKTRQEVATYIQDRLYERGLVKDPIVTVEFFNLSIIVLGEVNRPGRVEIKKDYFTILDALASVGDLTINGRRDNVMVSRQVDGEDQTFLINLCDKQDVLFSPAFYLKQDDIVYVAPTAKRKHQADSSGNAFSQPSFWISLASFVVSTSVILSKY